MAGSGKTTFMQRLNAHLHERQAPGYILNLDPAVAHLPYGAHVDIRDTVNYKNVSGWVVVFAGVLGGGELGGWWGRAGRLEGGEGAYAALLMLSPGEWAG